MGKVGVLGEKAKKRGPSGVVVDVFLLVCFGFSASRCCLRREVLCD